MSSQGGKNKPRRPGKRRRPKRPAGPDIPAEVLRDWEEQQDQEQRRLAQEQSRHKDSFLKYKYRTYALLGLALLAGVAGIFLVKSLSSDTSGTDTGTEPPPAVVEEEEPPQRRQPSGAKLPKVAEDARFQGELKKLSEQLEALTGQYEEAESVAEVGAIFDELREFTSQLTYLRDCYPEKKYEWDSASRAELKLLNRQANELWTRSLSKKEQLKEETVSKESAQLNYEAATALMQLGDWGLAVNQLHYALMAQEYRAKGEVFLRLAICEYRLGRLREARKHLAESLGMALGEPGLLCSSQELRMLAAEPELGRRFYTVRLERDRYDTDALLWMSIDLLRQGELDSALDFARRVVDKDPYSKKGHRLLFLLYCTEDLQAETWQRHARAYLRDAGDRPYTPLCQALLDSVDPEAEGSSFDRIVLKPGVPGVRTLEGKVIDETPGEVTIAFELSGGASMKRRVARSDIESIERGLRTGYAKALDEFRELFAELDLHRAAPIADLGAWCEEHQEEGIRALLIPLHMLAVEVDPDCARAIRRLERHGYLRDEVGRWVRDIFLAWPRVASAVGELSLTGEASSVPGALRSQLELWAARYPFASIPYVQGLICCLEGKFTEAARAFREAKERDEAEELCFLIDTMLEVCERREAYARVQEPCTRKNCQYGRIRCPSCDGTGSREDRYGHSLCSRCGQSGWLECPDCARRKKAGSELGQETYELLGPLRLRYCNTCAGQGLIWTEREEEYKFCLDCGGTGCLP